MNRFMHGSKKQHLKAVRQILKYIKENSGYDLLYKIGEVSKLMEYYDINYTGDHDIY